MPGNKDKTVTSLIVTTCCTNEYRLHLLKLSLMSLRRETGGRKQFIFCDNGDERQTEFLKGLHSYKHLVFGENKGIVYARNAGAEVATGDYICFLDGDMLYRPLWLSTLKRLLNKFDNMKLIAAGHYGEVMRKGEAKKCHTVAMRYQIWSRAAGGCLLMRKETWDEISPWVNMWKISSQFSSNAGRKGYRFIVPVPEVTNHMDYRPSYSKIHLKNTYMKGDFEWQML